MAKKTELKDRVKGEVFYPVTLSECVLDDNFGNVKRALVDLDDHLNSNTEGLNHIPSGGKKGQVLVNVGPGEVEWKPATDLIPDMILDTKTYGVSWRPNQKDPTLTRIGNMNYHRTLPIQSQIKGCIYNPKEKQVVYWLDEDDWNFKKDTIVDMAGVFSGGPWFRTPDSIPTYQWAGLRPSDIRGLKEGDLIKVTSNIATFYMDVVWC